MAAVFYYLIYNPAAGGGAAIPIFKQVKAVLDQRQLPYAIKTVLKIGRASCRERV